VCSDFGNLAANGARIVSKGFRPGLRYERTGDAFIAPIHLSASLSTTTRCSVD
jgi:hypothetical protein